MYTIKILWKNIFSKSKSLFPILIFSSGLYGFFVFAIYFQKLYLEKVEKFLLGEITLLIAVNFLILFYISRCITGGFLAPLSGLKNLYYDFSLIKNVNLSLFDKHNQIDLLHFESNKLYHFIDRVEQAFTQGALKNILNSLASIISLTSSIVSLNIALYIFNPLYSLFASLSLIPVIFGHFMLTSQINKVRKIVAEKKRRQKLCLNHIIGQEYYLETRISGSAYYFLALWEKLKIEIEKAEINIQAKQLFYTLLLNVIKVGCIFCVIILATFHMSTGKISIGTFSAIISILTFMHSSTSFFIRLVGNIYVNFIELSDVSKYFDFENCDKKDVKTINNWNTININNLSFKYPNSSNAAINNISLTIKKGQKIAIVGVNGAGKTTLISIILGLFNPTNGNIFYDDNSTVNIGKQSLYNRMSAVFQDFQVYSLSINDNVYIGDISYNNKMDVLKALDKVGFNYKKYNKSIDTQVGKKFSGIELSRGESQQLALARLYYNKKAEIVVIDEPTAALDPIAESKLYENFLNSVKEKTAFIISHRLGSTKIAERILVMDSSNIIEDGSHDELMKNQGLYAKMYSSQLNLYKSKERNL